MAVEPCIDDTCSVALSLDGSNNLVADAILDPDGGLVCNVPDGLAVSLDPDACNTLSLSATGLLGPYDHDSTLLRGGTVADNGSAGVTVDGLGTAINPDVFAAAYGTTLREITTRATLSYTNNTCRRVNIRYSFAMGVTSFGLVNGWEFAVGTRNEVATPHVAGVVFPGVRYDSESSPFQGTGTRLGIHMPPSIYPDNSFLDPGEAATITISLFAQALTVGPASTSGFPNAAGVAFNTNLELYAWTT